MKKRYITVLKQYGETVLLLIGSEAAKTIGQQAGGDIYAWIKKQLQAQQIAHHDQHADHHDHLPHQGGYMSIYIDDGIWMKVHH